MMLMLAIGDGWVIGMWAVQLAVSTAIAIVLAGVTRTTRKFELQEAKFERREASREIEVSEMNTKLHDAATKLIDERFRAMTHELNNHVNGFSLALDSMKERLRDGEVAFEKLSERDQKIELAVAGKFDQLKDFLRAELVTSKELENHEEREEQRFVSLEKQIREHS